MNKCSTVGGDNLSLATVRRT